MTLLGNILWLIVGGLLTSLGYAIGGILLCLTIIGIPFGLAALQIAGAALLPFGKSISTKDSGQGCLPMGFNILWLLLFGWEIALAHIFSGFIFAITIIGIPFAMQHFKMIPVALFPFSYKLERTNP